MTQKNGEDLEGALRSSRDVIEYFVESYDSGDMDLADSEELATTLREAIDREELLEVENPQE